MEVWLKNYNAMPESMQIGCGVYEHVVRRRSYLYFWHYETVGGRRRQIKEYLGPVENREVRSEAIRQVDAYFRKAARELETLRRTTLSGIARARSRA